MKSYIKTTVAAAAALAVSMSVQASISTSSSSISSWLGTPAFSTGAAPTTDSGGTSQDNDNWGGNAGGSAGFGSLAETFYLSTGGTLQNFQIVMSGAAVTFDVELYDLGSLGGTANGLGGAAQGGVFGPTPVVPSQDNFVPTTLAQSQVNLLSAGDQFVFGGVASGQSLFTLTPTETVTLLPNEVYALALDPTANADGTWWVRGGTPSASYSVGEGWNTDSATYAYAYQNFEGKSGPYSSGGRNLDTAVTLVPEPTIMALMGVGVAFTGMLIRRRKV
ncbi:MAG: PEP-CTERM sorting domain-containing protein [Verrucomicrobiia bacterium]